MNRARPLSGGSSGSVPWGKPGPINPPLVRSRGRPRPLFPARGRLAPGKRAHSLPRAGNYIMQRYPAVSRVKFARFCIKPGIGFCIQRGQKSRCKMPGEGEALTTDSGFSDYAGCSVAFRDTRELGCTLEKPRIPPRAKAKTSLGWMPDCRVDVCQKKARRSGPKVRVFAYCGDGAGDPFAAQKKRSWWLLVSCNCASVGAVVNWLPLLFAIERSTVSCQSPF